MYKSFGENNVESAAQVIIALSSLGIDLKTDERFIKNGRNLLDTVFGMQLPDGTFRHTADGKSDTMATEQVLLAALSYERMKTNGRRIYDLTDHQVPGRSEKSTGLKRSRALTIIISGAACAAAVCFAAGWNFRRKRREGHEQNTDK